MILLTPHQETDHQKIKILVGVNCINSTVVNYPILYFFNFLIEINSKLSWPNSTTMLGVKEKECKEKRVHRLDLKLLWW